MFAHKKTTKKTQCLQSYCWKQPEFGWGFVFSPRLLHHSCVVSLHCVKVFVVGKILHCSGTINSTVCTRHQLIQPDNKISLLPKNTKKTKQRLAQSEWETNYNINKSYCRNLTIQSVTNSWSQVRLRLCMSIHVFIWQLRKIPACIGWETEHTLDRCDNVKWMCGIIIVVYCFLSLQRNKCV